VIDWRGVGQMAGQGAEFGGGKMRYLDDMVGRRRGCRKRLGE